MDDKKQSPLEASTVDGLVNGMLKTIEKAARDFVRDWPTETYVRNDLPVFFEQGAMWAIRSMAPLLKLTPKAESHLSAADDDLNLVKIKNLIDSIGKIGKYANEIGDGELQRLVLDAILDIERKPNLAAASVTLTPEGESTKCTCRIEFGKSLEEPPCQIHALSDANKRIAELEAELSKLRGETRNCEKIHTEYSDLIHLHCEYQERIAELEAELAKLRSEK